MKRIVMLKARNKYLNRHQDDGDSEDVGIGPMESEVIGALFNLQPFNPYEWFTLKNSKNLTVLRKFHLFVQYPFNLTSFLWGISFVIKVLCDFDKL